METVTREQVLAYRMAVQGLHRPTREPSGLAIFDLGVQDSNVQSARVAIAIRLKDVSRLKAIDAGGFTLIWSHRASPHLHRTAELPDFAAALWPLSERDATLRLAQRGREMSKGGRSVIEAWELATRAMGEVVDRPMTKGEASAAMTAKLPDDLSAFCRGCNSTHIFDSLMRVAGLPSGIAHRRDRSGPALELESIVGWERVEGSPAATTAMIRRYLTLHGPATEMDVAAFVNTNRSELVDVWPEDLTEIRLHGKPAWIPAERYRELLDPPAPPQVRLVPLWDSFLQVRDRSLLIPDTPRQKMLWTMLASPGAVVVDGEVAGTWRARMGGKRRLDLTVNAFQTFGSGARREMAYEAAIVAQARGADDVALKIEPG